MESINFLLIFILLFLLMVLILRIINKSNNNTLLYVNNIDKFINKKLSKFINHHEGFKPYNENAYQAAKKFNSEAQKGIPVTTARIKKTVDSLPYHKESSFDCASCASPENSLENMIKNLDNLEEKCRYFEGKRDEYDEQEKIRTDKTMKEQIELEDAKIDELKEIVNYYRRKYNEKIHISSKCRTNKIDTLENTAKQLYNIENKNLLKNNDPNIEVNLTDFIKKQNIT